MFFCRHHLLRAPAQRHFATLITTRNASRQLVLPHSHPRLGHVQPSRVSSSHSPTTPAASAISTEPESARHTLPATEPEPPDLVPDSPHAEPTIREETEAETEVEAEAEGGKPAQLLARAEKIMERNKKVKDDPIGMYLEARAMGPEALKGYAGEYFASAIWRAAHKVMPDHFRMLVQDAILVTDERESKIRGRNIIESLFRTLAFRKLLSKEDILALLQCLERNKQLSYTSTANRLLLARYITSNPSDAKTDQELIRLMVPLLIEKLRKISQVQPRNGKRSPSESIEATSTGIFVPRALWPLLQMLVRLALLDSRTEASALLAQLADRQYIHADAIQATDLSSTDYAYIVLSVTVQTCMLYGWFARASELLLGAASLQPKLSNSFAKLMQDWLVRALNDPRHIDLQQAASAMVLLFRRAEDYVLPHQLLWKFYEYARELEAPELAQTVYGHSRRVKHHAYPPPRDETLLWMMEHFERESRNVHFARVLANHVIDENITLPVTMRAPFIAQTAVLGFATQARTLWERYAVGRDARAVTGNSKAMLRMTSLFMRNADLVANEAAKRVQSSGSAAHRENLDDSASDDQADVGQATLQRTAPTDAEEDDHPASDAPSTHSTSTPPPQPPPGPGRPQPHDVASAPPEHETEEREQEGFDALTYPELLEREADFRRFAGRVFDAYYETKLPLERARHFDLNSLARGANIVGRVDLCMSVFLHMRERNIKFDIRDVNVGLGTIAKANPVSGAEYIKRLARSGIQPDAVSFGTVIHCAVQHGDGRLVKQLIRQARVLGIEDMSFKTLGSLLHATVTGKLSSDASPREQLAFAENIVSRMLDQGVQPTPRVAWDCVITALRADDPVKAHRFWQVYLKRNTEWADAVQVRLRQRIAKDIITHVKMGWLEARKAQVMLFELGHGDSPVVIARLAADGRGGG
ncbi:hypothetical protein GY45DRAFT_52283 [Cubamyces sp. BRFM 1775]|nr:hypothetical protein GY45DRAFT_52283 [Cubamyces sp. BRFM 1775]